MNRFLNYLIIFLIIFMGNCKSGHTGNRTAGSIKQDSLVMENIFPFQSMHCHGSTIVELPNSDLLVAWFQGSGELTADDVSVM